MMIVNAVYFLARWEEQFNKKSTKQKPFYSKMREIQVFSKLFFKIILQSGMMDRKLIASQKLRAGRIIPI